MDPRETSLRNAIATISLSDPLIKLLEQVKLGRIKPTDDGLRTVIDSWMDTYKRIIDSGGLSRQALRRINPNPRLTALIEHGILTGEQQAVATLRTSFDQAVAVAPE